MFEDNWHDLMNSSIFLMWVEANVALDRALESQEVKKYFEELRKSYTIEPAIEALSEEFLSKTRLGDFSKSYYGYIDRIVSLSSKRFTDEEYKLYMEYDKSKLKERIEKESQQNVESTNTRFMGEVFEGD